MATVERGEGSAAVVIGSAQSACIGLQDIRSPMYVLAAAAIVNFLGDVLFVPMKGMWSGGAAGGGFSCRIYYSFAFRVHKSPFSGRSSFKYQC